MIAYWQNLNERERWMVVIAALAVMVYGFYLFIYSPLTTAVSTRTQQLKEKSETLVWMQGIKRQGGQQSPKAIDNSKLLSIIASQLSNKTFSPFPYQLEQTGVGDIQLSFEQVPYAAILRWLWALNSDYTVTLKQIRMDKTNTPGVVKLMVLLAAT
ncbi:type II secretion system protein M [Legionella taurinensis]|uniref:General secretion pathway protein GspM n=1 Tax=Legionella taurinensis TaxID=70611 RepID=A0A3A5LEN2_9GAMM|nr:type II secretion system protein GspM [Legionella taurinensis]MDX1837333.1 type II secretion system protein GspM [Legionella taurinensis]PUT40688.1 general secretion pathway protein GspM [Legionella taurinensis]PUT44110.1 general secretion pathway protein GspM [Legionella taurinensis]PUT47411.1 general secretion pathway protein GspM [Legionella taurinensis]PUT48550.1 general secretion pathway protein GspM [Legionella taurinensis]